MKKAFGFAMAGAVFTAGGALANGNVIYQNLPDTIAYNEIVNQDFDPDFPTFSTFVVDDVNLASATTITSIKLWYPAGSGNWAGVTQARVHFYAKTGSLPGAGDTPNTSPIMAATYNTGDQTLTVSGINQVLGAGDWWMGITPVAAFGTFGQRFLEGGASVVGDVAAYRNPGGGFGLPAGTNWGPASDISAQFRDVAMEVSGKAIPAPGAIALLGLAGLAARRRRRN